MRIMGLLGLLLGAGAVGAFAQGRAAELPAFEKWEVREFGGDGFSIRLPPGWARIPDASVEAFVNGLGLAAMGAPGQGRHLYKHVFHRQTVFTGRPEYPYALVDIRGGRVPQGDLARMRVWDGAGRVFTALKAGDVMHEPGIDVVWLRLAQSVPGVGPVVSAAGMKLTQRGVIQLNCYVREADFEAAHPEFEAMVRSMEIEPSIKYQRPWLERVPMLAELGWEQPGRRYTELAMVVVGALGVAGLVAAWIYRREHGEDNPMNREWDEEE